MSKYWGAGWVFDERVMKLVFTFLAFLAISPGSDAQSPLAHEKLIQTLLAKYEGFYGKNTIPKLLHNPGALSYAGQKGATRGTGGYAKWATDEEGWQALDRDLQAKIKKYHPRTLRELLKFWDSKSYIVPMAHELGIEPNTPLIFMVGTDNTWGWRIGYERKD